MKYTVKNIYSIQGESTHRTATAAVKAAKKREGDGWIVEDENGIRWWIDRVGNLYSVDPEK
jgi:hypothetical protein